MKFSQFNKLLYERYCRKISLQKFILIIIVAVITIASCNNAYLFAETAKNFRVHSYEQNSTKSNEGENRNFDQPMTESDLSSETINYFAGKFYENVKQEHINTLEMKNDETHEKSVGDNFIEGKSTGKIEKRSNPDENLNIPEHTHPLENVCKYGILHPWDKSLLNYMLDTSNIKCEQILPDIIKFQNGMISVDREVAKKEFNFDIECKYRPLGGTLYPKKNTPIPIGDWITIMDEATNVFDEQIEVQCYRDDDDSYQLVYKFALAHVVSKRNQSFFKNTENLLSINIIEMDSTSRNAFRRHMPLSFEYLMKELNAFDLRGFMKVADNTLPNLIPILTGLRYLNLSEDMPSDFTHGEVIDVEGMPSLWKEFNEKRCATLLNDDPVRYGYGFLHYPSAEFVGFDSPPTSHWFRPFYMYNRLYPAIGYPIRNASNLCYGNKFSFDYQLELHEQMSMIYNDTCHFAFTSVAELAHDECSNLELMDLKLKQLLQRLHQSNSLNHTVLIIMGDHGQRINRIRAQFVARIEERMPLFTVIFPEWFRKKHPRIMNNLRLNQNRLISNFDIYQTLKDISDSNFDGTRVSEKFPRQSKGLSLLHNFVSKNRTCREALVPENHCGCLIPHTKILPKDRINKLAYDLIKNYTQNTLVNFTVCQKVDDIKLINVTRWTLNQMVQHGVRIMNEQDLKLMNRTLAGNVEYIEVEYEMLPTNINALIRIQNDIRNKLFFIISDPPLVLNGKFGCKNKHGLPAFCKCTE